MNISNLSRFVLGHKLIVGLIWLVVFASAIGLMPKAMDQLSTDFSMPGSESADANAEIMTRYGGVGGFSSPLVPVIELPDGTTVDDPGVRDEIAAVFAKISEAQPQARVVSWASTGDDALVSEDRSTAFGLVYLPGAGESGVVGIQDVEQALNGVTVAGGPVLLSGRPALSEVESSGGAGVLLETLIGGGGALIVLLYVFGSLLAILPLVIAAVSIVTSFLVIGGVASLIDINSVVQYMVALIGLGIAIDYSLLVVTRWREEREAGHSNELAVQRAMETAGHAVVFSGTTVGVGLLALIVLTIQMLRGIGIGGLVIPVVSVIATVTLLPIILATIGLKLDWPRNRRQVHIGHAWERWATGIVRHRWVAAIAALVILGALLIPALQLEIGAPRPDALNGTANAEAGMLALEHSGIDVGVMDPFEIVVEGNPAPVVDAISGVDGVRGVVAPDDAAWRSDNGALIVALPQTDGSGSASREVLGDIREVTHGMDQSVLVGGAMATGGDFENDTYGQLPLMILVISVVTFLLLVRAFRSFILPLKAIVLNIISVGASFGVLVMIWQWGWGSELIWGIPSSGSITNWVPIMAFAFLFGLSMDYEVFILSRMREEFDATGDNDTAIIRGLGFTGRLVTCAALILFLAFAAMAAGPETEIKILATVLATGILLDATIVRALLVPALPIHIRQLAVAIGNMIAYQLHGSHQSKLVISTESVLSAISSQSISTMFLHVCKPLLALLELGYDILSQAIADEDPENRIASSRVAWNHVTKYSEFHTAESQPTPAMSPLRCGWNTVLRLSGHQRCALGRHHPVRFPEHCARAARRTGHLDPPAFTFTLRNPPDDHLPDSPPADHPYCPTPHPQRADNERLRHRGCPRHHHSVHQRRRHHHPEH